MVQRTVDHDQRRAEIVRTTWRIIARRGMAGATMRQIAAEAGFANGALKPYFPTKADLLMATYEHVFARTNTRIRELTEDLHGLDALSAVCMEILPLDSVRLDEGRVVIEFWSEATSDPAAREILVRSVGEWKQLMLSWCQEIDPDREWNSRVDALLTFLQGAQVVGVLAPAVNGSSENLKAQLEEQLAALIRD
ncbi:TetR/AcrR family transcriptional regulator [Gulosibacter chungangensis]|uniref:TetR family transcriptional regulator n=1 Tax=Gulosibacter chungangensis TaxID=979746 RepID=A0A7J5BB84_9MICO|nr:TetR/AcrR family transcriptional regulator [Gulosibacter chungangensis]KAB1643410.1 TetR family transcriptional regulator [Gulosibacter chungangensis]